MSNVNDSYQVLFEMADTMAIHIADNFTFVAGDSKTNTVILLAAIYARLSIAECQRDQIEDIASDVAGLRRVLS